MSLKRHQLKFNSTVSPNIKLSEDRLSACRKDVVDESEDAFLFTDQCLCINDDFQVQIMHLMSTRCEPLQLGVVSENPDSYRGLIFGKNACLKNSILLKKNILYDQNDENVVISEQYDIDLSDLNEGDLIGIKISEGGDLFFTLNGIPYRKAAENLSKNVWAFVNLCGTCSFICIIPSNSFITTLYKENFLQRVSERQDSILESDESKPFFHNYCGKEVVLTNKNRVAKRKNATNEFRNAVVISNGPLLTNELFRLRIEGLINKWNGSIELGVTFHNPDMFELPNAMNNLRSGTLVLSGNSILTNGHGTRIPYCTTSLDDLKIGDEIGIVRKENSNIHFFINNKDMGVAGNIPIEKNLWVIADLYGRTIKVSIPDVFKNSPILESKENLEVATGSSVDKLIFHSICGKNIKLSEDRSRACRIKDQEFNNGVAFTEQPLKKGERWVVKIMRCVDQWSGNMELGVTTKNPNDFDIPATMTELTIGHTVMLTSNGVVINGCPLSQKENVVDLETVHPILVSGMPCLIPSNTISVELMAGKKIQFFLNGADLGVLPLQTEEDVYGVVDLYGKAAEVAICSPGSHIPINGAMISVSSPILTINGEVHLESASALNFQTVYLSEENNDLDQNFGYLTSESDISDALKEADRSFLRLLSGRTETSIQPLLFHHIHGRNVILTNDGRTAYRPSPNNEFKNALVMSSRPLETDEIFEICVDTMTDHWSGSLEIGVTLNKPDQLNFPGTLSQLDKDCWILSGSCIMNNGITARNDYSLDMDTITVNSKIGLIRRRSGMLHFLFDGKDMGAAYCDVPPGIYAILDLYGQCSKVSITTRTGSSISGDKISSSLVEDMRSVTSVIKESRSTNRSNEAAYDSGGAPSRLSPFDRVMLVFKENAPTITDDDSLSLLSQRLNLETMEQSDGSKEDDTCLQIFDGDNLYGDGVRWRDMRGYYGENQKKNCVIQSKYPLKSNVFYEFIFISKNENMNCYPISFGFTTEGFNSQRYLIDNMKGLTPPNWIFIGEKLLIDNKVHSSNFAPPFSTFKKNILVGLYLHNDNSLEVFINRVKIGVLKSNYNKTMYMLVDLKGWYDTFIMTNAIRVLTTDASVLINSIEANYDDLLDEIGDDKENGPVERPLLKNDLSHFPEDPEMEDPIITSTLKELYELLPLFMISLKDIETSRLVEKMVINNNDIVLKVKRIIDKGKTSINTRRNTIRRLLINELSKRFSHLTELKDLGNSPYEIARALRRQIILHLSDYDTNTKALVVPRSCVQTNVSKLTRSSPGCDFGFAIINQELKSEKYKSYEIQIINDSGGNQLINSSTVNSVSVGLILIDTKHFRKAEDVFKFLLNIQCPKNINLISNIINVQLELLENEYPAMILVIDGDSVFLNGRQIGQNLPFDISNISADQFVSLRLRETEGSLADVYLSVRTNNSSINHLILSESLVNSWRNNMTVSSKLTGYFYVPFVWLNNHISVSIMTESMTSSQSFLGLSQANRREWLEKHYNDELNKESNQVQISEVVESGDRQCFSLKRSSFVKAAMSLPETYFKSKSAICFCNSCRTPMVGSINMCTDSCEVLIKGDPAKEFRLPLGWVKYNIRLKRETRHCLSLWHLAYLTVSPLLIHRLLASADPVSLLREHGRASQPLLSWLARGPPSPSPSPSVIVSPWEPLHGAYLCEDGCVRRCVDAEMRSIDPQSGAGVLMQVALEVRVRPHSYQGAECREDRGAVVKDAEVVNGAGKKAGEASGRPIGPRTVWVLGDEEAGCLAISGLLIRTVEDQLPMSP